MNQTIYFSKSKVFTQLAFGIFIWLAIVFIPFHLLPFGTVGRILGFILGGSFLYFGSKGLSQKPQIIITDEYLELGFKINKKFSWSNVKKIKGTRAKVDFREVDFIEVTVTVSSKGKVFDKVIAFPVHLLDLKSEQVKAALNSQLIK